MATRVRRHFQLSMAGSPIEVSEILIAVDGKPHGTIKFEMNDPLCLWHARSQ